ncbi:hypothetical protein BKA62DRAFT_748321 [Auriculariales sp. MPI-PUGE-AT-0066]|nr:hypothetical protein BKA62DRAFT_748321 [Auriculariales sp. MPI-PUGE-AT-0066]
MSAQYHFATFSPPTDPYNPINTFNTKYEERVAINTSTSPDWTFHNVPKADLAPGVLNEGTWPRYVMYEGTRVLMQRHEWDQIKLEGTHICHIPQQGLPIAARIPEQLPELDSDDEDEASEADTEFIATPRTGAPVRSPGLAPHRSGSPMESVVSRIFTDMSVDVQSMSGMSVDTRVSYMSVDSSATRMRVDDDIMYETDSEATARPPEAGPSTSRKRAAPESDTSTNLPPNAFGKRAKAPKAADEQSALARSLKRHHGMRVVSKKSYQRAKYQREKERKETVRKQQELADQMQQEALRASWARTLANDAVAREHERRIELMRQRMFEIDRLEKLEQARRAAVEADRIKAAQARATRRLQPYLLEPKAAFDLWLDRIAELKEIRAVNAVRNSRGEEKLPIYIHQIPFPVLFRPDYSLHLVTEQSMCAFFQACLPFFTREQFNTARSCLHDTHYRGEAFVAGEGYEDEGDKDFVIATLTRVAAFTNDHVRPIFDAQRT